MVMETKAFVARIVPAPRADDNCAQHTRGTQVFVGENKLSHVTKIVLTAQVDDLWRAEITCFARGTDLEAMAIIHHPSNIFYWLGDQWAQFKQYVKERYSNAS
jgi:hypothetical protein